jgi:hypothetical protein
MSENAIRERVLAGESISTRGVRAVERRGVDGELLAHRTLDHVRRQIRLVFPGE